MKDQGHCVKIMKNTGVVLGDFVKHFSCDMGLLFLDSMEEAFAGVE